MIKLIINLTYSEAKTLAERIVELKSSGKDNLGIQSVRIDSPDPHEVEAIEDILTNGNVKLSKDSPSKSRHKKEVSR